MPIQDQLISSEVNRAAIILAGGEGTRLAEVTRRADGGHVPKQFCNLLGGLPLLDQTRRRVSLSVPPDRTVFVLNRDHERFFSPLLADVPVQNLIVQPGNRGTAPAILYSLLRLAELTPRVPVLLMPSDHYVGDEAALMRHVDLAFTMVEEHPERTVILGIAPAEAETGYGWIEPGLPAHYGGILPVRRFWEKPSGELASQLMAKGCLWNSFIIVAQLQTLMGLFMLAMPELYISFMKIRLSIGTPFESDCARRLYRDLRPSDFSRDLLQSVAGNLSVLRIGDVGWCDLGEPHRVARTLARLGMQNKLVAA